MIHRIARNPYFLTSCLLFTIAVSSVAQTSDWKTDKKAALLFGLTQPLAASGFNIEANYIYNRFIIDYSHGVSLDFSDDLVTDELREQGIAVHIPWTTGFGVGYRLKEWVNVRVEPKWHRFEFYYDGDEQNEINRVVSYNTFSLGIGVYGFVQPFKNAAGFAKGITIAPSVRFWPTVNSTLKNESFTYTNRNTGGLEKIEVLDPGIGFTPFVFNVSIGYTFDLKRK